MSLLSRVFAGIMVAVLWCNAETNRFCVASWNVENLFDIENDPNNDGDDPYTPLGTSRWNASRYAMKLKNLARVIAAMQPDVLCLVEIENRRVLKELVYTLKHQEKYDLPHIIQRDSTDPRGIDTAILSREPACATNWVSAVTGQRDIAIGTFRMGPIAVTIMVNHWKSQLGKKAASDAIRTQEALALKAEVDRQIATHPQQAILVAGDFNDQVDSAILTTVAGLRLATDDVMKPGSRYLLYNLAASLAEAQRGSYYYSPGKKWNSFDSISVSRHLLAGPWTMERYEVYRFPQHVSRTGAPIPFRRVRSKEVGDTYVQGFSDHFPVRAVFRLQDQSPAKR